MRAVSAVRLVAVRELRERGRSKAFWAGTIVLLVGVVAATIVPAMLGHHGPRTFQVGTVRAPGGLASSVISDAAALGGRAHVRAMGSAIQARSALAAQTLDLVVEGETTVLVQGPKTDQSVTGLAHLVARDLAVKARLQAAGLPAGRIRGLVRAAPAPVRSLLPVSPDNQASKAIVVAGTIILYFALTAYGGWVTSGVLEEKSSRVAEVILSAVRPPALLAGKVIGIGLLGLGQLAAVAASSRQEQAPTVAGPLTVLILLGYLVSLSVLSNPDGALARITPFVPPLAPLVMPVRMLLGHPQPWELPASAAVMLAATYGLVRLAGRAYSGNILRFGGRVTLRDAVRP